ncbi:MAG: transaldolase [Mizugakiibacter sp.]|uniref:transaldolase n=1 Tax=Mizugakiibacter sp. TaxID=1972610 RepID=UPI0031C637E3|nr:transaldolase [Xanthomonadaceae bacterium]
MRNNPLWTLRELGQGVWLDSLSRRMLADGTLARLIAEDGVSGVTSNPTIFEHAFAARRDYEDAIARFARDGLDDAAIVRALMVRDVVDAADLLRPVHVRTAGADGYVSIEVSPHLAYDTVATIREARALWAAAGRPNVLVKVPATAAGLAAIRALIADGIGVNVTLLFGTARYEEVVEAYLCGLEERRARGGDLRTVASVASFFLSRIDSQVDPVLERLAAERGRAVALHGQTAMACARDAYRCFREVVAGARFRDLRASGARAQRLVWASTGTKNPAYSDIKYVESLVGADTFSTMPPETLAAYRDHGQPQEQLLRGAQHAKRTLQALALAGIRMDTVAARLEAEGVRKFQTSHDRLLDIVGARSCALTVQA